MSNRRKLSHVQLEAGKKEKRETTTKAGMNHLLLSNNFWVQIWNLDYFDNALGITNCSFSLYRENIIHSPWLLKQSLLFPPGFTTLFLVGCRCVQPQKLSWKTSVCLQSFKRQRDKMVINIRDLPFFFILISLIPTKSSFCVQNRVNNTDNV